LADQGQSFNELIASLSGLGSTSANLADIALTGESSQARPLTDFDGFSKHVFFGDAIRKFRNSIRYINDTYPIGMSGGDVASLCAENVYSVDKWKKEAKGFDLYMLDQLGLTSSVTASSTNHKGESVPLIHIRRDSTNTLTGSQTGIRDSISAESHLFEDEGIDVLTNTPGSANDHVVYSLTSEESISRGPNLKSMLPQILFQGDGEQVLERLVGSLGDMLDEIKQYVDQLSNTKKLSYDDVDRIPNRFLPVLASHYGIDLHQSALKSNVEDFLIQSSSGATSQDITYAVWNRIMNNMMHLLKHKGSRETIESIGRIYGIDHNFLKADEYTLFNDSSPTQVREIEELDVPTLFSTGDVYAQVPTGTVSAFDFAGAENFTLQARISATAAAQHKIIVHPAYTLELNAAGQVVFSATGGTSVSTTQNSISSFIQSNGNFLNVVASRTGDNLKVWAMVLSGSGSGIEDNVILASGVTTGIEALSFNSSGGSASFGAYFPGSGSFSGYIHEVRAWDVPLEEEDLKEHTRNFQSTSFINSSASNAATYGSLDAHYKLKENAILTGSYNYIVDSTTGMSTATPVNFSSVTSDSRYQIFPNMKKISKWYPSGLSVDNDKVRTGEDTTSVKDETYVSFHLTPMNQMNRHVRNIVQNINIIELLGDPEDLYKHDYTGSIKSQLSDILTQIGTSADLVDFNTFIKAMSNFNDVMGSIFPFLKQFLPARTHVLSEGVLIEDHILSLHKNKREPYTTNIMTPTASEIQTHFIHNNSGVSAATTATMQGFKYSGKQLILLNSITSESIIRVASTNVPRFSTTRVGRRLPATIIPADVDDTEIEITLSRLGIHPSATTSAANGNINGAIRLLQKGKPFRTATPALRIEFPSSADGTNYFVATVGDIDNGRGRVINEKDVTFVTNIETSDIQLNLQLASVVRSLSADAASLLGTIGVVPVRITNLFNNNMQLVRLAIGNEAALLDDLQGQGGVKIIS
jgi:hypothetical protein